MPDFCHLHTHTQYSLLDGASRIKDLILRARQHKQPAVAITDHGSMFGVIEFYKACKEANAAAQEKGLPTVKPILGMEAYVVPDGQSRTKREKVDGEYDHHCLLWAADNAGYKNLMKLSSKAYAEGFYMHPRIDLEILAAHRQGLIASSGCLGSEVPNAILHKDYEAAKKLAGRYIEILGKENFYFELQNQAGEIADRHPGDEEIQNLYRAQKKVNEAIVRLAKELGGKLIATNDSHYTDREDAEAHDALLCIGTGKLISDANRLRFACGEFYLKSSEEMAALFRGLPEALANTLEIAERCNVELKFGEYHFPKFQIPKGQKEDAYFRKLVYDGLERRYGKPLPGAVVARADEELRVLTKMGFLGYLLIVWDITRTAREKGIPIGPGRGSAAGSIVCYGLGITNLDPLKYNLLFERFVNEGRNEMPDIDIDFCPARRSEVIEYVQDRYGRDSTAGIITFNTMAAKASVRDLGRVMDWPLPEVDKVAKMIPALPGKKVTLQPRAGDDDAVHVVDDEPDLKNLYESDGRTRNLIDLARRIEGLARNPGRHAAGLVIADKDITEYLPLYKDKDDALLTQYEMSHIDSVGLLKIDILGLQNLTILERAVAFIKQRHGVEIDLDRLPLDDKKTYAMLARGEAKGVFQFESDGMVRMLVDARPDCLEDLIALNAMYRPGPMQNIPTFINRKHGREPIDYLVPQLEPILKDTYGIIVYQEQVMQIANQLGGFTLSEADSLRKAMGKKKKDLMEKYGKLFVEGCGKNGIAKEKARELYDLIAKFAEYGFNKSHSAAYAFVAYQTAYLKANYTAEYMAALLSLNQGSTDDVIAYLEECRRMNLEVLGPDINTSHVHFAIASDRELRYSLGAIKGVGEKAVETMVQAREADGPFKDLHDLCERVDTRAVNKSCLESLVRAGAFDSLKGAGGRAQLVSAVEDAMAHGASLRRDREAGQGNLFGGDDAAGAPRKLPDVPEWPEPQRLEEEKKVLGFYFSGHPLADVREIVEGLSSRSCRKLGDLEDGLEVVLGAYVNAVHPKQTRTSGEKMAVLDLEDWENGSMQAVVFPKTYAKFRELIQPDRILFFRGKIKHSDLSGGASVMADEIFTVEDAVRRYLSAIVITLREPQQAAPSNGNGNGKHGPEQAEKRAKKEKAKKDAPESAPVKTEESGESARKLFAQRLETLAELVQAHPGRNPVWFQLDVTVGGATPASVIVQPNEKVRVRPSPELFAGFRSLLPRGSLRVIGEGTKPRRAPEPAWKRFANGNGRH
ncbi:MAG: DNA polymerase III subunit alpha [Planctomycetota bacterium]|nr:DNA polymerase III subunit alpha [Planctomycetota bacterium]